MTFFCSSLFWRPFSVTIATVKVKSILNQNTNHSSNKTGRRKLCTVTKFLASEGGGAKTDLMHVLFCSSRLFFSCSTDKWIMDDFTSVQNDGNDSTLYYTRLHTFRFYSHTYLTVLCKLRVCPVHRRHVCLIVSHK